MPTSRFEVPFDKAVLVGESDGFGLPVVFLHAGVADRRMWAGQMETLAAAGFHVIAYDRRGFGETTAADEPFSHLVDLETLLDRLGIHAAILVGSSDGGALAIDFALEYPERTIGLVLAATSLSGAPEPEIPEEAEALFDARAYAAERGQHASVAKIDAHLWLDGPLSESGRVADPALRELFIAMDRAILEKPALTQEEEAAPAADNVGAIAAPALLVVGDLDFPHIIDRHDELSEELENAFSVVLEGTAHFPSLERPDLFDPLLLEFLEAVAGVGEDDDSDGD